MKSLLIPRFKNFNGNIKLPGSKSIANRILLCCALSKGTSYITDLPLADDIQILLEALPQLGISLVQQEHQSSDLQYEITSQGHPFSVSKATLQLQNAGTAIRPLTAILCAGKGDFILSGNKRMQQRPIADLCVALKSLGADIQCAENGCPPVRIQANGLQGGEVSLLANASSQFVSALLMAAPLCQSNLSIRLENESVSQPYIDMTLAILEKFNIRIQQHSKQHYTIPAPQKYQAPQKFTIEGDATAATYFAGAAALPGCGPIHIENLGFTSIQGDLKFMELLARMGAEVNISKNHSEVRGPKRTQKQTRLKALDINMNDMPDAAMTLAVLALFCDGTTHIRDIANLRLKESERIRGLKNELEKLGAKVEETKDSLHITPPKNLRNARIECYDDHRMAMAFSLAAYGAEVEINAPLCVSKTYKNFFNDFLPLCS